MRTALLTLSGVLLLVCGCQSGQRIETRTHALGAQHAGQIPMWEKTIETTVAPEKWNEQGSPHRISAYGDQLTIRTTKSNHDAILKYLSTVIAAQ